MGLQELVEDFILWCNLNHLQLNTGKTKEMVVDFCRSKPILLPVSIEGVNVDMHKYLGIHLDNKLDWSANTEALYQKGQRRLCFLRRRQPFNVCSKLLWMIYQSVVAGVLFYAVVCWGGSTKKRDAGQLERLVRKAGSVVGAELECITSVSDKRTLSKLLTIMDNDWHPLYNTIIKRKSLICYAHCHAKQTEKAICPQGHTTAQSIKGKDRLLSIVCFPLHRCLPHIYTVYWLY